MLRRRTQHFVHANISEMDLMSESREDHRAILEACQLGDADLAAQIMRQHLSRVGQELVEYYRKREQEI